VPTPPRQITFHGRELTIAEWSKELAIPIETIRSRLNEFGWTVEKTLTPPIQKKFRGGGRPAEGVRRCPKLKKHSDGRAYCRWEQNGKENWRYFGKHGTKAVNREYARFQVEWANGQAGFTTGRADKRVPGSRLKLVTLVDRAMTWIESHYVKDGKKTSEVGCFSTALHMLTELHEDLDADEFEIRYLKACQKRMIELGRSRNSVNAQVRRIIKVFRWGA
jgi:hypothetical protein